MPVYTLSGFTIQPPGGKTEVRKRLRRFNSSTVEALSEMAEDVGQQATEELRARLRSVFNSPDSTGRTAESARFSIRADRQKGVTLSIYIGGFRHVGLMTNLAGGNWHSHPYYIRASNKKYLSFYWRRARSRFRGKFVRHPGFPEDVPMNVGLKYRDIFVARSLETVSQGIVTLTAGSQARSKFKPVRKSVKR